MKRDEETLLVLLGVAWLASKYSFDAVKPLERAGATLYEVINPSERDHADDLPGKRLSKPELVELARSVGFPDPNLAAAVALAESRGYPGTIRNEAKGGQSVGLWQIYLVQHPMYSKAQMRNPIANAQAAYAISARGTNWRPWSTYKHGTYRRFL